MREIILFAEDFAHESFLSALIGRISEELGIDVEVSTRSATGGHGRMMTELKQYLRDLSRSGGSPPDALIVARDANCHGYQESRNEVERAIPEGFRELTVFAIPDPHIERWLLLDPAAFKAVFGRGCTTPDYKCEKERYKGLLIAAVQQAGVSPLIGGVEHAEDIVRSQNLHRVARADSAFGKFLSDLRTLFRRWQNPASRISSPLRIS